MRTHIMRRLRISLLGMTVVTVAAACGSDQSKEGSGPSEGEAITVQAAQFTWTSAELTNKILAAIAKQYPELGVAGLDATQLDPAAAWAGAKRGDVDLLTEVALPNQQQLADQAAARVEMVSQTYGDASQGWFVPTYAVKPGGPAEGLKSVEQLNDFKDALGGKLYDADPGWVTTEQNTARLKGYGVDYEHVVAGEAAELAQLERAYRRQEPILVYLYHPHWVFSKFDMTQLQEGRPYQEDCFTTGDGACAMPAYSANVAASKDLQDKAPRFAALLRDFRISLAEMEDMLKAVDVDDEDADATATAWVDKHADEIASWVKASG